MKTIIQILTGCAIIAMSTITFAYSDSSCGSSGCRLSYCSECECTDPSCGSKGYNNCLSKSKCCEAFGNVGAR